MNTKLMFEIMFPREYYNIFPDSFDVGLVIDSNLPFRENTVVQKVDPDHLFSRSLESNVTIEIKL